MGRLGTRRTIRTTRRNIYTLNLVLRVVSRLRTKADFKSINPEHPFNNTWVYMTPLRCEPLKVCTVPCWRHVPWLELPYKMNILSALTSCQCSIRYYSYRHCQRTLYSSQDLSMCPCDKVVASLYEDSSIPSVYQIEPRT